jgi:uncharacterized membrane protein
MRASNTRSRVGIALLLAMMMLLAVPAPALSAPSSPAEDPIDNDNGAQSTGGDRADAKWTYMVYMSADNNLEDEAILNVNQMEVVGSNDDVNIVIQLDRSPDWDETNGNWTGTRRYLISPDSDPDVINSQLLEDMGEVDMGKGESLKEFVIWAVTNYPADRFYLDVWGHGGGWRDGTCNDYTSGSVIDTDELGIALKTAEMATNTTLDGVGFDQCLMAQLEVFYEIKQFAHVLVGAETLIPAEGYNYTRPLEALTADPDMTSSGLADVIVSTFFDEYGYDNERAHSAVDAETMDASLSQAMTRMAQLLRANASSLRDEIKLARDNAQTFSTLDYIDLGNFTEHLLRTIPVEETELRQAITEVRQNVTAVVVAEDHGTGRSGSTGLSFYFPRYGVAWSYANLGISKEGRWDEFLDAYFDRRDRPNTAPTVNVTGPLPGSVVGLNFEMDGTANDTDGNVTNVEWKFDRGPWQTGVANDTWSANVSTDGLHPGLHRISVRSRDDAGDYSPEVQFQLNVESRGFEMRVIDGPIRTYPGTSSDVQLQFTTFGDEGGTLGFETISVPSGIGVDLPSSPVILQPGRTDDTTISVTTEGTLDKGTYLITLRAWMTDAPLIQSYAVLKLIVIDRWPDLVVEGLTFDPPRPVEDQLVTINMTVRNTGLLDATDFDVDLLYRFSPGVDNSTVTLTHILVGTLRPGDHLNFSATWTASIGLHEFIGIADRDGNNSDLDVSDNVRSALLLLEGYSVRLGVFPRDVVTAPGTTEHFGVLVHNDGNLQDILQIERVTSTLGWRTRFNTSVFLVSPQQYQEADMWVDVPSGAPGGSLETITLKLTSGGNPDKFHLVTITLHIPEVYDLRVYQDKETGTVGPLHTDSYNVTIENEGNGWENYTLEYLRQSDHLLVSAVNDTVEVGPGDSATVEVFYSTLGSNVGGQTLAVALTVRSSDNSSVMIPTVFQVTVIRVFGLTGIIDEPAGGFLALPGAPMPVTVAVTNEANYAMDIEIQLLGDEEMFVPDLMHTSSLSPGSTEDVDLFLWAKEQIVMGMYDLSFSISEVNSTQNMTTINASVRVQRTDSSSLSINSTNETALTPGENWKAKLLLRNEGNHPETFLLEVTLVPKWLLVELGPDEVTVPAYGEVLVPVEAWLLEDDFDAPKSIMVVVTATPANQTGAEHTVVLDVPLDVPGQDEPPPWWFYALVGLTLLAVVALAVTMSVRNFARDDKHDGEQD